MSEAALHPSIVALVSLAANIAANHPKQGLCQVDRLKAMGVSQAHIDAVVEIARHIRNEAGEKLDYSFDQARGGVAAAQVESEACCTPTASGQSCC
ncbi:MAG: hypothetical protein BGO61_05620 [Thiobacillus sp. 65-69]|nr:hypothetical protein [Thiobacillus sp.]ODU86955.1 MAG: hypothetical protein ABT21_14130 [Thiobacillus sp. SCN 65-179]OJW36751.1 MAG: hypothetical protein BGO61_05620 [Thiobacillus sp. 65-69]